MDIHLTVPDSIFTICAQHSQTEQNVQCLNVCTSCPLDIWNFNSHHSPANCTNSHVYFFAPVYMDMKISINLKTELHQISAYFTKEVLKEYLAVYCFSSLEQIAKYYLWERIKQCLSVHHWDRNHGTTGYQACKCLSSQLSPGLFIYDAMFWTEFFVIFIIGFILLFRTGLLGKSCI